MSCGLLQIFFGSFILSLIHALIPNHWIPLVAIGRTEKWTRNRDSRWSDGLGGKMEKIRSKILSIQDVTPLLPKVLAASLGIG